MTHGQVIWLIAAGWINRETQAAVEDLYEANGALWLQFEPADKKLTLSGCLRRNLSQKGS